MPTWLHWGLSTHATMSTDLHRMGDPPAAMTLGGKATLTLAHELVTELHTAVSVPRAAGSSDDGRGGVGTAHTRCQPLPPGSEALRQRKDRAGESPTGTSCSSSKQSVGITS